VWTGFRQRYRQICDSEKCANCHEWFEGHGGNRVYTVEVCAMCHNPNLSASAREVNLDYPETSNNLKDMIHGIHSPSVRDEPLEFVRNRSGGTWYTFITDEQLDEYPDGDVIAFPGDLSDCETCHYEGTYGFDSLPDDPHVSTYITSDGTDASTTDVAAARDAMPNDTDLVMGVAAGACSSCHFNETALAHMEQNGAAMYWTRSEYLAEEPFETCELCHGEGRSADIEEMHSGLE